VAKELIGLSEGVVWINGEFVRENEAVISIRDPGFIYGDAVFDTARTFNGEIFKLDAHLDRLWMSCRYIALDPPMTQAELGDITREVAERNYRSTPAGEDLWVTQRVTRGRATAGTPSVPTVIVETTPLPLRERARYFMHGIPVVLPSVRRTPPWALSPRAKTHNYLNMVVAQNESTRAVPGAWPILLDEFGNVCEGLGSNIFTVVDGVLRTPGDSHILAGVSRATTLELTRARSGSRRTRPRSPRTTWRRPTRRFSPPRRCAFAPSRRSTGESCAIRACPVRSPSGSSERGSTWWGSTSSRSTPSSSRSPTWARPQDERQRANKRERG